MELIGHKKNGISNLNLNAKCVEWNVSAEILELVWKQSFSEPFFTTLEEKLEDLPAIKTVS